MLFTQFTHDFTLFLSPWCFELISGIFGDFKVFTLHTRLRCFDRRLATRTKPSPSIQSLPQGLCKARKPSRASKIQLCKGKIPFGQMATPFRRVAEASGELDINSGEWLKELKEMKLDVLETPNGAPFGRMGAHSGESPFNLGEFRSQTARFLFPKSNSEGF